MAARDGNTLDRKRPVLTVGYKDAFAQWWTGQTSEQTQHTVLSFLPFYPKSDGSRVCTTSSVKLSGKDRSINEVAISHVDGSPDDKSLVMLHGYGTGLGIFYRNLDGLSSMKGWKVYALDLLGYGRSSRPHFHVHAKEASAKIDEAEAFFIDALEEWRVARDLTKFTLMGHSLGGYLAVAYARKYPGRLDKLILVSPVGVLRNPYVSADPLPDSHGEEESAAGQVAEDMAAKELAAEADHKPPLQKSPYPSWLVWLWEQNFTPFQIVRASGPLGPRLVSGWTGRRFLGLPPAEYKALHNYSYTIFKARGSGEFALGYILAPGAYARRPLIDRIKGVGVDVTWLYGANDWMDKSGGEEGSEILRKLGHKSSVHVVPDAGHNIFLDNPQDFNRVIIEELYKS